MFLTLVILASFQHTHAPLANSCCYGCCPFLLWKTHFCFNSSEQSSRSLNVATDSGSKLDFPAKAQIYLSVVGLISTELLWFS